LVKYCTFNASSQYESFQNWGRAIWTHLYGEKIVYGFEVALAFYTYGSHPILATLE